MGESIDVAIGSAGFRVDLERAPAVIAALEEAISRLEEINSRAQQITIDRPPGGDPYSPAAVAAISAQSAADDGRHGQANLAFQTALRNAADNIRSQLAAYHQTEDDNTLRA